MLLLWLKRSYGVGNLMTITFWVLLRNVSFVFTSFLLKNGQNLNFRIFGQHFFNFCSLIGYLVYFIHEFIFMHSYLWISYHQIFCSLTSLTPWLCGKDSWLRTQRSKYESQRVQSGVCSSNYETHRINVLPYFRSLYRQDVVV